MSSELIASYCSAFHARFEREEWGVCTRVFHCELDVIWKTSAVALKSVSL